MSFAENLKLLRGKTSRKEFAELLGIRPNTLRNYEEGLSLPNFELGLKICDQFKVNPYWLLKDKGPMNGMQPHEKGVSPDETPVTANDKKRHSEPPDFAQPAEELKELREECRELRKENRELNRENRQLIKDNGDLRVELVRLKARFTTDS